MDDTDQMPPIVSRWEIGKMLGGVTRQYVHYVVNHPTFPKPYVSLHGGDIWRTEDVEAWIAGRRQLIPMGRPRKARETAVA